MIPTGIAPVGWRDRKASFVISSKSSLNWDKINAGQASQPATGAAVMLPVS
jgi:hypothetical protein